jgi:maleate cis-trans isomerase
MSPRKRSVEAVAAIEARIGKPVVTSNQSTVWTALRALGITRPITGFGRLLENLTPAHPAPAVR